ncbi:glycosyltransferase, partial [Limosilactobacillus mucosae]
LEICKTYQLHDKRIKVYTETEGNQGAARNLGIDKATGDYLMFVDSDDYVSSDFCQIALSSIAVVGFGYIFTGDAYPGHFVPYMLHFLK